MSGPPGSVSASQESVSARRFGGATQPPLGDGFSARRRRPRLGGAAPVDRGRGRGWRGQGRGWRGAAAQSEVVGSREADK